MMGCAAALFFSFAFLRMVALPRALARALLLPAFLAVLSASMTVAMFAHLPPLAVDAALLLIGALVFATTRRREQPREGEGGGLPAAAFLLAAGICAAAIVSHLLRNPDGGNDAFIIWNLRARWLFRAGENFGSAFSPEILYWAHPDYPLMLPALVARGFAFAGTESRVVPAIAAVLFTAAAAVVVVTALPRTSGWLAGLALVTTPALVTQASCEQADVPLAAFLAGAVAILLVREKDDRRGLAAAGAFASMAALTKNEGALYLLLVGSAVLLDERDWRSVAAFIAGALPLVALLMIFKLRYAPSNDLLQATAETLQRLGNWRRWAEVGALTLRHIVLLQVWGLHLVGLLAFLWCTRGQRPPRWLSRVPPAALLVHGAILVAQPHEIAFMYRAAADRLLIQLWPAILLLASSRDWSVFRYAPKHAATA